MSHGRPQISRARDSNVSTFLLVLRQQLRIGRVLRRISIGAVLSRRRNVELVAGTGDAVLLKVILKEKDAQFRLAGHPGPDQEGICEAHLLPVFQRQVRHANPQIPRPMEKSRPGHITVVTLPHPCRTPGGPEPRHPGCLQGLHVNIIGPVGCEIPHSGEQGEGGEEQGQKTEETPRAARPALCIFHWNDIFSHSCGTSCGGSSAIAHISSWAAVAAGKSTSSPSFHSKTASSPKPK